AGARAGASRARGGRLGLQRQRVDRAADLAPEDLVYQAVLLDATAARERLRGDRRAEMIAAARVVLDVRRRAGNSGLYAVLELLRRGHRHLRVYPPPRASPRGAGCGDGPWASAILWKAMVTLSDKGAETVHEVLASQPQG